MSKGSPERAVNRKAQSDRCSLGWVARVKQNGVLLAGNPAKLILFFPASCPTSGWRKSLSIASRRDAVMWSRFRVYLLILIAGICGMTVSQWSGKAAVAVPQENPRIADLRDRLVSGLKVRTTAERQFVEQVLQRAENNTIPLELVDSAFLWVRSNKADHDYPFFYFERVLRIRGKRAGVSIPPFKYPTKSLNGG